MLQHKGIAHFSWAVIADVAHRSKSLPSSSGGNNANVVRQGLESCAYISNHSSGKMGYALAAEHSTRGELLRLIPACSDNSTRWRLI